MDDTDIRPSIAEIQRLYQDGACRCERDLFDRDCGVHLPPVLLDIVAAALAWRGAERRKSAAVHLMNSAVNSADFNAAAEDLRPIASSYDAAKAALDAALDKVKP